MMSVRELRELFERLASQYEYLSDNRTKLEGDCAKLREYIDSQVQQIQSLNADFEKLRLDYVQRRGQIDARLALESEARRPPAPISPAIPAEDPPEQDWEVELIIPPEKIDNPLIISLLAEILDVSVVCSTAFSPDGACLAIGSDKTLRVYNIEKDSFLFEHTLDDADQSQTNHIRSIAWAADSKTLLCGGEDGKLRVFGIGTDSGTLRKLDVSDGEVFQVAISNDNSYFAAASGDGVVSLFRLGDFELIGRMQRDAEIGPLVATSVAISPDDRLVAVGYGDLYVGLWDFATRRLICETRCHTLGVYAVKFVPNSRRLVTASLDATVKIWDVVPRDDGVSLELYKSLEGHSSYVLSLAVDPTGDLILSGSKDLTACVSSISAGAMLYRVKGHTNSIITVAYNPNGTMFCTGSGDQAVKVWSVMPEDAVEDQ